MNINIQELAREIAVRLAPDALLNAEDVAALLKCSTSYVLEQYVHAPGFPPSIRIVGPNGRRGHPRWRRSEIMDWIDLNQETNIGRAGRPRNALAC